MGTLSRPLGALAALAAVVALTGCTTEVPPAHVGIKFSADTGLSEKLITPQVIWRGMREQVYTYPTSLKNATFVRNAQEGDRKTDDSIVCSTNEGALLPVDVTVVYHVAPENVLDAFLNFGTEDLAGIQHNIIRWNTVGVMNEVSGKHSIFDLTAKDRQNFGPEVKTLLQPLLLAWGVTVDDVYIGEVYPPEDVKQKINERIQARNLLELAKVQLQQATIEAKTTITNAERDAETNKLLAEQGKTAIDLERMKLDKEAIEKWDGHTPTVGSGTIPFTDIKPK
ncbi:MAG TPA: SPFH domain-containing protein [Chthonomonadaceae bacterium]|nr:SPFH domain-containing protein [Chthonomonadaceae bacterium]